MIDAYEIGIQLMLQEDVTAGLAVINRGLAEVDRAIAATSANLAGLVREAGVATKAVAGAVRANAARPGATGEKDSATVDQALGTSPGGRSVPEAAASPVRVEASAPEFKASEPVAPSRSRGSQPADPPAAPTPAAREQPVLSTAPTVREPVVRPSAPIRRAADERLIADRPATVKPTEASPVPAVAPAPVVPTVSIAPEVRPPVVQAGPAARLEPRRSVTPRADQVAMTAAVNREPRLSTTEGQPKRARQWQTAGPVPERELSTAPRSAGHRSGVQTTAFRHQENTAAMEAAVDNQFDTSGGTVMLDGRMVGQWLSDHMGREASRPPAGTSFFDPRQTPAWTVSGAL